MLARAHRYALAVEDGRDVMRVHASLVPMFAQSMSRVVRYGLVNGLPGFVTMEAGETLQTTALEVVDGTIVGIYIVRNPDKLRHLEEGGVVH